MIDVKGWARRMGKAVSALTELPPVQEDGEDTQAENEANGRRQENRGGTPPLSERSIERIPPGQKITNSWPRLDDGNIPSLPDTMWSVSVERAASSRSVFSLDKLALMPMREMIADIHCVTGWSRLDMTWKGVQARVFAEHVGLDITQGWVMARSVDGYCANIPMARFMDENTMLAMEVNGSPLSREHGGPVRLLIPSLYLWKSVKWLAAVETLIQDCRGTWEQRGYHNNGDPWLSERWRLAEKPEDGYP